MIEPMSSTASSGANQRTENTVNPESVGFSGLITKPSLSLIHQGFLYKIKPNSVKFTTVVNVRQRVARPVYSGLA
jgi:hypothetical protein